MDEVFRKLEKAGRTDVDNLMKWLKDSKIIETVRDEKVRRLFKDAVNQKRIELQKFKEVVAELAREQSKTAEQLSKQLADTAPKVLDAAAVGFQAFKEALKK
ncbi:hypothetical protein PYW08_011042 [Mythimna loreyi]|uniref:Uncharacterized protein n=1 Tax=Mythimna loreyi TaxID=667449 RepID=A0ACC2Q2U3_9NEOP|nr:hypothetical protein PYW08_011042 [Mythimna loreyi]